MLQTLGLVSTKMPLALFLKKPKGNMGRLRAVQFRTGYHSDHTRNRLRSG